MRQPIIRREFLRRAAALVGAIPAASRIARASVPVSRSIQLRNIHTDEVLHTTFQDANGFLPEALKKLQHLLRDYRTGEEHEIDCGLYVQLCDLAQTAGREPRYEVISGYRSPATNSMLHATGHGVAEHSLHMQGHAIDVRLRGYDLASLHELALAAGRGGVGYYPQSNFIHLDTGRVRRWTG
jgi:uncharacterized protein YcbK (DUF882 family)